MRSASVEEVSDVDHVQIERPGGKRSLDAATHLRRVHARRDGTDEVRPDHRRIDIARQPRFPLVVELDLAGSAWSNDAEGLHWRIDPVRSAQVLAQRRIDEEAGKLRRREGRLQVGLDLAGAGVFDWNLDTNAIEWTDGHCRLFGLEPRIELASFQLYRRLVHPDDLARVVAAAKACAERLIRQPGRHASCHCCKRAAAIRRIRRGRLLP